MSENIGHCPLCGGDEQPSTPTVAVDLKFGAVVVTEVPVFAHHQLNLRELFLPERGMICGLIQHLVENPHEEVQAMPVASNSAWCRYRCARGLQAVPRVFP